MGEERVTGLKDIMYFLVKNLGYDSSSIKEHIGNTQFKLSESYRSGLEQAADKEGFADRFDGKIVNQSIFNKDGLNISWYGGNAHLAMWQELYIARTARGGLNRRVELKEHDHRTVMWFVDDGKRKEVKIDSFSPSYLCSSILEFLGYHKESKIDVLLSPLESLVD